MGGFPQPSPTGSAVQVEMNIWGDIPPSQTPGCHGHREGYWQMLSWKLQVKPRVLDTANFPHIQFLLPQVSLQKSTITIFSGFAKKRGRGRQQSPGVGADGHSPSPEAAGRASNHRAPSPSAFPLGMDPAAPGIANKCPPTLGASWACRSCQQLFWGGSSVAGWALTMCARSCHQSDPSQEPVSPARGCWNFLLGSGATPTLTPSCFSLQDQNRCNLSLPLM